MSYIYTVTNNKTNEVFAINAIKDLGRKLNVIDMDASDNWFLHNLTNMTASDYVNTNDKSWMVFEYNEYSVERKGENTTLTSAVVDGNAPKKALRISNANQALINQSVKQISVIRGFLAISLKNAVAYNNIIAKQEAIIARLSA